MSLTNIKATLVNAYVTGGFGMPTAYENKHFTPDNDSAWAAVSIVPNQPSVATLGDDGTDNHDGFLQIDLNYPLNGGDGAVLAKADEIRAYFKAGARFRYGGQTVVITSCGRSHGREVRGMYQMILTINWYARTAR